MSKWQRTHSDCWPCWSTACDALLWDSVGNVGPESHSGTGARRWNETVGPERKEAGPKTDPCSWRSHQWIWNSQPTTSCSTMNSSLPVGVSVMLIHRYMDTP